MFTVAAGQLHIEAAKVLFFDFMRRGGQSDHFVFEQSNSIVDIISCQISSFCLRYRLQLLFI
jgi:hypothetical protein